MAAKQMKFQEAMKRLDEIVALLNNNELELEEAMSLFEEGLKLSAPVSYTHLTLPTTPYV